MWNLIFVISLIAGPSSALFDGFGFPAAGNSSFPDLGALIGIPWLTTLLLGAPRCGSPATCPNFPCRQNPAVYHGYCCGCASPFDLISVPCPGNIQCPIYRQPLCTDFRYMIDCCCRN